MTRLSLKMLFMGLVLLFLEPALVFATDPGHTCTKGLSPCGTGCYEPAAGDVCCSNASTSWSCPAESVASSLQTAPTLFSTSSVTSMTTETITLDSVTSGATPEESHGPLPTSTVSSTASTGPAPPVPSGMPGYSTINIPSDSSGASCLPTTVTVTSVSISYISPTASDYTISTLTSASSNSTSGTQTALTSITLQTSAESSVSSEIITTSSESTDVAATTPTSSAMIATSSASSTTASSPSQPAVSYTPGNDSAYAAIPSIFGLYMILMGLVFI